MLRKAYHKDSIKHNYYKIDWSDFDLKVPVIDFVTLCSVRFLLNKGSIARETTIGVLQLSEGLDHVLCEHIEMNVVEIRKKCKDMNLSVLCTPQIRSCLKLHRKLSLNT